MLAVQEKLTVAGGGADACGWTASSGQPRRTMSILVLSIEILTVLIGPYLDTAD